MSEEQESQEEQETKEQVNCVACQSALLRALYLEEGENHTDLYLQCESCGAINRVPFLGFRSKEDKNKIESNPASRTKQYFG